MINSDVFKMKKEYRLSLASFGEFAEMQSFIRNNLNKTLWFDCSQTSYISPAFSTLFGSLPHYGMFYDKTVKIRYDSTVSRKYIHDMGILRYYQKSGEYHKKAVPFTSLNWDDYNKEILSAIKYIMAQLPVTLSPKVTGAIISQLGEIFNNAKDHSNFASNKNIRLYYCGHHNAKRSGYIVSIYDTGVGITQNVSEYLDRDVDDAFAVDWAFGDGNSTQNSDELDFSRGIGLNSLEKFIKVNNGQLYVCSGDSVYVVKDGVNYIKSINGSIKGTLYVFSIQVDPDHIYVM